MKIELYVKTNQFALVNESIIFKRTKIKNLHIFVLIMYLPAGSIQKKHKNTLLILEQNVLEFHNIIL